MPTERLSNIELCRIAAILGVMLIHSTFQSLGYDVSLGVMLLAGFSIIGVDVFVMLTGLFSATPKKSSLINLAFVCFFWMIVKVVFKYSLSQPIGLSDFFFLTESNWFIPSYIGLLFFTPILNVFCNSVDKQALKRIVLSLLLIEIWFDWLPPHPSISLGTNGGHSVLSFIILYLLARYIRLYGIPNWIRKNSLFIYITCSIILALWGSLLVHYGKTSFIRMIFADNNPIVILSAVSFLSSFEKLSIRQSKCINHISRSVLAVLLGHSAIFLLYTKQFKYVYDSFSGIQLVFYWAVAIVVVFLASIALDQIRLILYKPIERWVNNNLKQNILFEHLDNR